MKKIIMTRDIRKWFHLTRKGTSKLKPKYPYCGICSERRLHRPVINYIHAGEECYEVHFANNGIAYYHVACMDQNSLKAQTIKSLDVDKWNGIDKFIESRMCNNQSDSQIMGEIAIEFKCSHTTAWRRFRDFKTKIL